MATNPARCSAILNAYADPATPDNAHLINAATAWCSLYAQPADYVTYVGAGKTFANCTTADFEAVFLGAGHALLVSAVRQYISGKTVSDAQAAADAAGVAAAAGT